MTGPRVVFLGTGDIAIPCLQWLIDSGQSPVALVTQPDRPAGRKRQLKAPAIKEMALAHGIDVLQPERIRHAEALDAIEALRPGLIVVMAYGQILPQRLIGMAPGCCVNLHASLLPKYRGAACIQAAIDAGDATTGVTLMHVVKELDAGDVILARETPILDSDTGGTVHDRLAQVAVEVLKAGLPGLLDGTASRRPQAELGEVSHVPKLERDEGRIDWSWTAERLERRLRAYDPWPGCWAEWGDGAGMRRLKVFPFAEVVDLSAAPGSLLEIDGRICVACGEGGLVLGDVQPEGSRRMAAMDWWRGMRGQGPKGLD
jgi:methionyl-tRNA formyltransferase